MRYQQTEVVKVYLQMDEDRLFVGRLAQYKGQILFEYDSDFLSSGLQISPFNLPLKNGVQPGSRNIFEGLPGVFNDSLPDGWGRLLLDRAVLARGIPFQRLTPLDRLAHVGVRGMGALIYEPDLEKVEGNGELLYLDKLHDAAQEVLSGESQDVIEQLFQLGGSSAGARPKVLVGYDPSEGKILSDENNKCYEPWMVKFASSSDQNDIGNIEYAYSKMAKSAGIEMPETRLFEGESGRAYFGVKRFDRVDGRRVHMHTASGLLNADHRYPSLDYENLIRTTLALCKDMREVNKVFRLACFNVLTHNRDDHSKNFSFLMNSHGNWTFSPAYDLTFSYGPGGEHSATVAGEGRTPGKRQLMTLAEKFNIKDGEQIIEEVRAVANSWQDFAKLAGVSSTSAKAIQSVLEGLQTSA